MNKISKLLVFILFSLLGVPLLVFTNAKAVENGEKIENYKVAIGINQDSSINVQETIDYNFGSLQKHGIYRNIPYKYSARGGSFKLRVSDISVEDNNGSSLTYTKSHSGGDLVLKIGDADALISGNKTYVISYKVERAINYFSDYDELYWNAIGTKWSVPIEYAQISINLYNPLVDPDLKYACYEGTYGSDTNCTNEVLNKDSDGKVTSIDYSQENLLADEGMTVVIGTPKGYLHEPTTWQKFLDILKDNLILLLPIAVLMTMLRLWIKKGRDPEAKGTVIAEFEAPKGISTAEAGLILRESVKTDDVSAAIIKLAVDGFLRIEKIEKKGIFSSEDYNLIKMGEGTPKNPIEAKLLDKIFEGASEKKLSELKNKFYKDLAEIKSDTGKKVVSDGYYAKSPATVRAIYITVGILIGGVAFFVAAFGYLYIVSFVLSGVIIIFVGFFMPARTAAGVEQKRYLLGLRQYINVAEKDRIKFHNAPTKTPKHFEALLPFAMVFGLEREWGKQFEGIYKEPPSWYSDSGMRGFNSYLFASSLHNFNSAAAASISSAPSSASGGGSGFSGGGSGGGFGGGGGGSW